MCRALFLSTQIWNRPCIGGELAVASVEGILSMVFGVVISEFVQWGLNFVSKTVSNEEFHCTVHDLVLFRHR